MTRGSTSTIYLLAGGSIGALLGFSMGLSSSPVVSTVLAAIGAALLALLGLRGSTPDLPGSSLTRTNALTVLGFGVFAALGIVGGLLVRTHDLLSPSLVQQRNELKEAGFSDEEAHTILLYRQYGPALATNLDKRSNPVVPPKTSEPSPSGVNPLTKETLLFAMTADECLKLDPSQYADMPAFIESLRSRKGKYEKLAGIFSQLSKTESRASAQGFFEFLCR